MIIKTTQEIVFGGYTEVPWGRTEEDQFRTDPNTFIFLYNKKSSVQVLMNMQLK